MHKDKIRIWEENEYNYPMAFGFVPHLMTYLHEDGLKNRPDAAILAYPVITSGEYAHQDSFKALLGMKYDEAARENNLYGVRGRIGLYVVRKACDAEHAALFCVADSNR